MSLKSVAKKVLYKTNLFDYRCKKASYSQSGEDLIIQRIFSSLNKKPVFMDIGANHPYSLSNTYLFYKKKQYGVCVEPDPKLFEVLRISRPKDVCMNVGISSSLNSSSLDFYLMSASVLNTFSREEAQKIESYGTYKIVDVIKVPVLTINEVLTMHSSLMINYISLDIEGMDYEVLKTINFDNVRPDVFCVETLTYTENKLEEKKLYIDELMMKNNYFVYADTYLNTIYVDIDSWNKR